MRRGSRLGIGAAIAVLMSTAACAARSAVPAPPATAPPPGSRLSASLDALFSDPRFSHALWAAEVRSLVSGDTLYSLNAQKLMIPGSNQKLVSTIVAAERLGWDYRFTTRLIATGPIRSDGVLDGDLVVVGDGDPSINPRDPARWRVFDDWAAALAARGVRAIGRRLVGDDNLVAEPGFGFGWSWDDLVFGYGAPPSALQYNENQVEVIVGPGMMAGARAIIATSPPGGGFEIRNEVVTAAAGSETTIALERVPGAAVLKVRGTIAADARPVTRTAAARNPTVLYLTALRAALARHGIFVGGDIVDIDDVDSPRATETTTELLVDRSPPLASLVDVTLKWSRNEYAETLLTALSPEPPASAARGLEVLRQTLDEWGLDKSEYVARDGSGLSRYDYVTARLLNSLLARVWSSSRGREAFRSSLPEAGESGTLADRMQGTAAQGRAWAKTGTLSNVRALSGYVLTRDGEPLVFSILANHFRTPPADVEAVMDRAVVALAEFTRR